MSLIENRNLSLRFVWCLFKPRGCFCTCALIPLEHNKGSLHLHLSQPKSWLQITYWCYEKPGLNTSYVTVNMLPYQNILLTVFPSPCYSYSPPFSRVSIGLQAACIGECMEIQHWNPALWLLSQNEALYNHLTVCLDSKYPTSNTNILKCNGLAMPLSKLIS